MFVRTAVLGAILAADAKEGLCFFKGLSAHILNPTKENAL
jgi:hypothetical protein